MIARVLSSFIKWTLTGIKQSYFVFFYVSFVFGFLAIESCSRTSTNKAGTGEDAQLFPDSVSCDQSQKEITTAFKQPVTEIKKLTAGQYDYQQIEFYFDGHERQNTIRYHINETPSINPQNGQMTADHQNICYEGFLKKDPTQNLKMDQSIAPSNIIIREAKNVDSAFRQLDLIIDRGQPTVRFLTPHFRLDQSMDQFKGELSTNWDHHGFVHKDVKTYELLASKKIKASQYTAGGTLYARVTYIKKNGNILKDGELSLIVMPEVSYSLWSLP